MKDNNLEFLTGKYNPNYSGYWKDFREGGSHLEQDPKKLYQYGADDIGTMFPIKKKYRIS